MRNKTVPPMPSDLVDRLVSVTAKSSVAAESTRLAILLESFNRRTFELEKATASRLVGRQTRWEMRRRRERDLAAANGGRLGVNDGKRPWVNWQEGGQGDPLLLLNGWTASGLAWPSDWIERLEQRFRVIRIDNRGSGWSRWAPAPFTIADLADDARDVLRACQVERATVLGLSMGGMVAQELAMRHPGVVDRLVLVATRPPTPAQITSDLPLLMQAMRPPADGQELADYFHFMWAGFAAPGFAEANPDVMSELVSSILKRTTPRAGVLAQSRAIFSWHGAHRLARVEHPTTVIHGSQDPLIPVGNGMRLSRLIPDASYLEIDGAGHLLPHEAPDLLAGVLGA